MFSRLRKSWHHFASLTTGHRFQTIYRGHQRKRRSPVIRVSLVTLGIVIIAVGLVALPAPGPGFLVIGIGGALLARESLAVARAMDWIEMTARRVLGWGRSVWNRASTPARVVSSALVLLVAAAAIFWAVKTIRGA